jgi:hypothetical protein
MGLKLPQNFQARSVADLEVQNKFRDVEEYCLELETSDKWETKHTGDGFSVKCQSGSKFNADIPVLLV